jgi:hypothetical protein
MHTDPSRKYCSICAIFVSYLFAIALRALALQHVDSILRNYCEYVMPYFKFLRFEDKFDRRDPDLKIDFIGVTLI